MRRFSETSRQTIHIAAGGFALLLVRLTWWQAALLAASALVINVFVLPRWTDALFRPGDRERLHESGIVIYPLSVLALVLAFPQRPDIVAAAWGILAAGDGFATLVGAHAPIAALPWNRAKSAGGTAAFVIAGALAGVGLATWTRPAVPLTPLWFSIVAPIAAAVAAAFFETIPIALNDNITVPATAAAVLWSISLVDANALSAAMPLIGDRVWPALVVNGAFALTAWLIRGVTTSGAVVGALIGVAIWLGFGGAGWAMLCLTFIAATAATRVGLARKTTAGIAEARGGRRGCGNALANTGIAAGAALVACGLVDTTFARIIFVAALATAASDTVASEVGKAWGKRTWLMTSMRRVAPGTSGAVSLEGTTAGVVSALLLASIGAALGIMPAAAVATVTVAAVVASFVEGWLAIAYEARGVLNNDMLNFLNTAIGAALAVCGWSLR